MPQLQQDVPISHVAPFAGVRVLQLHEPLQGLLPHLFSFLLVYIQTPGSVRVNGNVGSLGMDLKSVLGVGCFIRAGIDGRITVQCTGAVEFIAALI